MNGTKPTCRSRFGFIKITLLLAAATPFLWGEVRTALAQALATSPVVANRSVAELVFVGSVEAVNQATMTAQTSGQIVELNFDVNDFVKEGQVLLRIKGEKTQAGLAVSQSGLKEAQAGSIQAEADFARVAKLFDKKMVTAAQMDQVRAALDASKARVGAAHALVLSASETASDAVIKAPFSGYVLERFVQLGETAQVGRPLFSGMALEALRVLVYVPQQSVEWVRQGGKAKITDLNGQSWHSENLTVFPYADSQSRDFGVRIQLPKGTKGLLPGMLVKVAFAAGEREQLLIPEEAVVHRSEVTGVYVEDDQGVTFRRIRTGRQVDARQIEVLSGLTVGERLAVDPLKAGLVRQQTPVK